MPHCLEKVCSRVPISLKPAWKCSVWFVWFGLSRSTRKDVHKQGKEIEKNKDGLCETELGQPPLVKYTFHGYRKKNKNHDHICQLSAQCTCNHTHKCKIINISLQSYFCLAWCLLWIYLAWAVNGLLNPVRLKSAQHKPCMFFKKYFYMGSLYFSFLSLSWALNQ